jgi:hypothetical protein
MSVGANLSAEASAKADCGDGLVHGHKCRKLKFASTKSRLEPQHLPAEAQSAKAEAAALLVTALSRSKQRLYIFFSTSNRYTAVNQSYRRMVFI